MHGATPFLRDAARRRIRGVTFQTAKRRERQRDSPLIPTVIIPRHSFIRNPAVCLRGREPTIPVIAWRSGKRAGIARFVSGSPPDLETLYPNLPGKTRRSITAKARAAEQRAREPEKIPGSFERGLEKQKKNFPAFLDCRLSLQPSRFGKTALVGTHTMRLSVQAGGAHLTA